MGWTYLKIPYFNNTKPIIYKYIVGIKIIKKNANYIVRFSGRHKSPYLWSDYEHHYQTDYEHHYQGGYNQGL